MTNRFGFKDFLQIVLLGAVLVLGFLQMKQQDRDRILQQDVLAKLAAIEKAVSRQQAPAGLLEKLSAIESQLAGGVVVAGGGGGRGPAARDESWAVPGILVEWQEPWSFASDPREVPGFAEGGEFTEIFEGQPAKITPYLSTDVYGRRVIERVADSLGAYDPETLRFRGLLASAWQQDPDGRWIRVRIRDDARFSDGEPVTAEDVRWTYQDFIFNQSIEAERARSLLDQVEGVRLIDAKTVEFTFNKALSFNLESTLSNYVLPKHFYERFEPAQINSSTGLLLGSGPYRLARLDPSEQWAPGSDIVLVRNENYYGPRSPLEALRFKTVQDELPRLVAYRNGEGDMIIPSAPQFVKVTKEEGWDDANHSLNWINMR